MKEDNKNLRIGILVVGVIFYFLFFTGFIIASDSRYNSSFFNSYYYYILINIFDVFPRDHSVHNLLVPTFWLLQAVYAFCIWKYRENLALLIRKFIKNI